MKYLLLIALVAAVWWAWSKRKVRPNEGAGRPQRPPEAMVACAWCGVNAPLGESVADGGEHFCCDAHRLAARSGGPR